MGQQSFTRFMFGYITVNREELKVRELDRYQAYYCGLCRELHTRCGRMGQLTLTYDMTFLAILLGSLYETDVKEREGRCIPHPAKKHRMLTGTMTAYAADMNVLLAYHNLLDDWKDDRRLSRFAAAGLLKDRVSKITKAYPRQAKAVREYMQALAACEAHPSENIEAAAALTGRMLAEIFVRKEDRWAPQLRQMGFFLGKFVYLIDAYEDVDKDIKSGSYNPLKGLRPRDDFDDYCRQILMMQISECCKAFEFLPVTRDAGILRNILYSGVWTRFAAVYRDRKKGGGQGD